jgi:hypothetical protein
MRGQPTEPRQSSIRYNPPFAEPMNNNAASQHACPFHNISEDGVVAHD